MKFIVLILALLSCLSAAAHEDNIRSDGGSISYATKDLLRRRGELVPPTSFYDLEEMNRVLFSDLRNQSEDLKKVKYYLLNGEIRHARATLAKLAYTQTKLRPVIFRYLGILSFIEGKFEKSFEYLALRELQNIPHFGKICFIKVLDEIVLNKKYELEKDWEKCKVENQKFIRESHLVWLETLVQLKINPKPGMTKVPFKALNIATLTADEAKIMLKLALYLNQESLVVEQLPLLTLDQLEEPEVRELAGQIFFRTGKLAQSYRFVEDLKSPNSENIKGNLYLLRNKYEVAYAQFKVALEQKQNSQNAMERLLPLAWLLGDWEGGVKYSEMVLASPQTQVNKLVLTAAFLMQKGDYDQTSKILESIAQRSRRGTVIDITQIASFTALMQNKPDVVKKQAALSCNQYDLVNCWVLFQISQWDGFPVMIRREDPLPEKKEWERLMASEETKPLKETVYVNQLDIEEMDDKLIQLIPKDK